MTDIDNGSRPNPTEQLRSILVLLATLGMIAFGWMALAGMVGDTTPAEMFRKYGTPVTPADYVFSIWALIHIGLIAFSLYQLLPTQVGRFTPVRSLYILTCVLNCAWIYFWTLGAVTLCLAVIVVLWLILLFILSRLTCGNGLEIFVIQAPFGLYFGMITGALLVNFAATLAYLDKMPTGGSAIALGSILVLLAAAIAVFVTIKFRNYFVPLAIAWVVTAIAIKQSSQTMIVVAAAAAVVACLIASLSFVTKLKSSETS